jgi:phosphatidylglycerophosphate synthase
VWLGLAFVHRDRALQGASASVFWPLLVFVVLGATDVIDGWIARRYQLQSNFGATLDAVADKLAQIVTVTFLVWLPSPAFSPLPVWLWAVLVVRDGLLGGGWLWIYARHRTVEVRHRWHGKLASLLLFALITAAIARAPEAVVTGLAIAATIMIIPGTVAYLWSGQRQLGARPSVRPLAPSQP